MSANAEVIGQAAVSATLAKTKREVIKVQMQDGREVEFGLKQKLDKTVIRNDAGTPTGLRFDYSNGQTRTFALAQFADVSIVLQAHGLSQKLGDEGAGTDSVDDMVYDIDTLADRLAKGVWSEKREGGVAGVSILATALVEATGQTLEQIRAFLTELKNTEKDALKQEPRIKSIIDRLQAEKVKKSTVDLSAVLAKVGLKAA